MFHLLFLYFLLIEPIFGYKKYNDFIRDFNLNGGVTRIKYYNFILFLLWGLTLYFLAVSLFKGITFIQLGFKLNSTEFSNGLIIAVLFGIFVPVGIGLISKKYKESMTKQLSSLKQLLPETTREKWYWFFISFSAGCCEELLFRSFMFIYLPNLWGGIPTWGIIFISSIIFGFAHTYQGIKGVLITSLSGVLFAVIYDMTGSIYPGMLIHFLIDLRILAFLPSKSLKG